MVLPIDAESRLTKRKAAKGMATDLNPQVSNSSTTHIANAPHNSKRPRITSSLNEKSKVSHSKRKSTGARKKAGIGEDDDSLDGTIMEYSWPVEPFSGVPSRTHKYYSQIRISLSSSKKKSEFNIRHGGNIRLLNENGRHLFCHVNRFSTRISGTGSNRCSKDRDVKVEGYWFLNRSDLIRYFGLAITPECQEYIDNIQRKELVLTNTWANLAIAGVDGNIRVLYIQPEQSLPIELPPNTYFCRYTLEIDTTRRTLEWRIIDPLNLDVPNVDDFAEQIELDFEIEQEVDEAMSPSIADSDDSTVASSSSEDKSKITLQEGGGAAVPGEIRVDAHLYQADVEPYVPAQSVRSRKPLLVYRANAISDDELYKFLNDVSVMHNKYLIHNRMVMEDPYSPLAHNLVEKVALESHPYINPITGSYMSTASMIAGKRCQLLKECDSDIVLEILASHAYDTTLALRAIERNLNSITTGWTKPEKDIFDAAFRRHHGSLREVTKVVTPTKNSKDVIDYFYRFKVPDQFRKFQDKKRELAVRMIECIETKKQHSSLVAETSVANAETICADKSSHWSEKSVALLATVRDERIQSAKRLLLDVKDHFGTKRMTEVASVIRQLKDFYEPEGRNFLFTLLDGHPELQRRFLEFLPKHF